MFFFNWASSLIDRLILQLETWFLYFLRSRILVSLSPTTWVCGWSVVPFLEPSLSTTCHMWIDIWWSIFHCMIKQLLPVVLLIKGESSCLFANKFLSPLSTMTKIVWLSFGYRLCVFGVSCFTPIFQRFSYACFVVLTCSKLGLGKNHCPWIYPVAA